MNASGRVHARHSDFCAVCLACEYRKEVLAHALSQYIALDSMKYSCGVVCMSPGCCTAE